MNQITDYTPAALYARVSSDRQDVDLSISAQLRALRDYARKNGYIVAREYVDEAESGRIANRPEFRKMIDEAARSNAPFGEIPHPTDTIDTENSGTRGPSIWVHSSEFGLLGSSVPHQTLLEWVRPPGRAWCAT